MAVSIAAARSCPSSASTTAVPDAAASSPRPARLAVTAGRSIPSVGAMNATTPPTPGSATAARRAADHCSGVASARTWVGPAPVSRPARLAASVMDRQWDSELPITATRRPLGSGWAASTDATSNSSPTVSTSSTPASAKTASTSSRAATTVLAWLATGTSGWVRPTRTATTGLRRPVRRASRVNLRGLPIESGYRSTTSVPGSSSQYCRRSLTETSTRLPAETKLDSPIPRSRIWARIPDPSAPDWVNIATRPDSGITAARDALSATAGSAFTTPSEAGPTTRIPYRRAASSSCADRARPSAPASANPREQMTRECTPFAAASSTTAATSSAGTAITARSTWPGTSRRLEKAGSPATTDEPRFTG